MNNETVSRISNFADRTKFSTDIASAWNVQKLHKDLCQLGDRAMTKCKVMNIGYRSHQYKYFLQGNAHKNMALEEDSGVVITNDLNFLKHCIEVAKKV